MTPRAADRLAVFLLALLAILAIGPSLLPSKAFFAIHPAKREMPFTAALDGGDRLAAQTRGNFETGDQLFQVLPERRAFNDAIKNGEWPLWWREAGGGISLIGAPGAELLEPRALILSLLFGEIGSLAIQAVLVIFTIAALAYWWFRLRDFTIWASAAGALIFASGGALTSNLYYICKVDSMILLPGGLVAIELWFRGRRGLATAVAFLAAADSILASFPQNTALCVYCLALLTIFRLFEEKGTDLRARAQFLFFFLLALICGFATGAVHLLTMAEWAGEAQRSVSLGGEGFRAGPANWLSMIAPLVLGDPTSESAIVANPIPWLLQNLQTPGGRGYNFTETTLYAGLGAIPLLLAGAARGKRALAPAILLFFCLAISAGTPLAMLPGVSVSAPSRALAGASFFIAWLAAEGFDGIANEKRPRAFFTIGIIVLFAVAATAAWIYIQFGRRPDVIADRAFQYWTDANATLAAAPPDPGMVKLMENRWSLEITGRLIFTLFASLATAACAALALSFEGGRRILILLIAADLLLFARHILPAQTKHNILPETPAIRDVRREADGGRVARVAATDFPGKDDWELFQATLPSYFNINDTSAYVIFPNANQVNVAAAFDPRSVLFGTFLATFPKSSIDSPIFDLFGVKVLLCREKLEHPGLEPVCARPGFYAYKRKSPLGRAWIAPVGKIVGGDDEMRRELLQKDYKPSKTALLEPPGTAPAEKLLGNPAAGGGIVNITDRSRREVQLSVRGTAGGFLVESAPYCSGWTATLDGFPTPIYRANRYGRAVWVPEGDHEVVFSYMPRSFIFGGMISLLAILIIPFVIFRAARSKH